MAKIPDIRKMQQITENNHFKVIEAEREMICREIEKAANKGDYYLYIGTDLANKNIELLKEEGYKVQRRCDEWGVGITISWHPGEVRKRIFNF